MAYDFDGPCRLCGRPLALLRQGGRRLGGQPKLHGQQCDNRPIVHQFQRRLGHWLDSREGIEWAFAGPWSAKIEYDYIKLSSNSFTVPTPSPLGVLPGDVFTTANRNIQTVLFGVNYRFGGW